MWTARVSDGAGYLDQQSRCLLPVQRSSSRNTNRVQAPIIDPSNRLTLRARAQRALKTLVCRCSVREISLPSSPSARRRASLCRNHASGWTPLTLQQTGLALIHKKHALSRPPDLDASPEPRNVRRICPTFVRVSGDSPLPPRRLGAGGIIAEIFTHISGRFGDRRWLLSVNDLFQPCSSAELI